VTFRDILKDAHQEIRDAEKEAEVAWENRRVASEEFQATSKAWADAVDKVRRARTALATIGENHETPTRAV
jgi:ribosome recycling factor